MKRFITLIALALLPILSWAQITPTQAATLKTMILADQTAAGYFAIGDDTSLKNWLNSLNTKVVWRYSISVELLREALVAGAAQLDGLTAGKRDTLLFLAGGELINTATLRASLDDLTGSQATLKAAVVAAEKRTATRAEAALATGTGTTASPATMTFEGLIDYDDTSLIHAQ